MQSSPHEYSAAFRRARLSTTRSRQGVAAAAARRFTATKFLYAVYYEGSMVFSAISQGYFRLERYYEAILFSSMMGTLDCWLCSFCLSLKSALVSQKCRLLLRLLSDRAFQERKRRIHAAYQGFDMRLFTNNSRFCMAL